MKEKFTSTEIFIMAIKEIDCYKYIMNIIPNIIKSYKIKEKDFIFGIIKQIDSNLYSLMYFILDCFNTSGNLTYKKYIVNEYQNWLLKNVIDGYFDHAIILSFLDDYEIHGIKFRKTLEYKLKS